MRIYTSSEFIKRELIKQTTIIMKKREGGKKPLLNFSCKHKKVQLEIMMRYLRDT